MKVLVKGDAKTAQAAAAKRAIPFTPEHQTRFGETLGYVPEEYAYGVYKWFLEDMDMPSGGYPQGTLLWYTRGADDAVSAYNRTRYAIPVK